SLTGAWWALDRKHRVGELTDDAHGEVACQLARIGDKRPRREPWRVAVQQSASRRELGRIVRDSLADTKECSFHRIARHMREREYRRRVHVGALRTLLDVDGQGRAIDRGNLSE